MRILRHLGLLSVAAACVACSGASIDGTLIDSTSSAIVGGAGISEPAAVFITQHTPLGFGECSGALVSPHVVLTAAHCAGGLPYLNPATYEVTVGTKTYEVKEAHFEPSYMPTEETDPHDIGILILQTPVTDVAPLALERDPLDDSIVGQTLTAVAYGSSSFSNGMGAGGGLEQTADFKVASLSSASMELQSPNAHLCDGDSGSPILANVDGVDTILGVTSVKEKDDCSGGARASRVDVFAAYIDQYITASDPPPAGAMAGPPDSHADTAGGAPSTSAASPSQANGGGCSMMGHGGPRSTLPGLLLLLILGLTARSRAGHERGRVSPRWR